MERKVDVVEDLDGNKIVFIHDVKLQRERNIEKILKSNIVRMPNLDGIDMSQDLHCQCIKRVEKLRDTMCLK